jgi:xanthine dehydrogenase accessory factor
MITARLSERTRALAAERSAFVVATVVRAKSPTSARPGDVAVVLADGTVEGFVGGVCAESSLRLHALRAMETGEPLLLRLVPDADAGGSDDAADGAVVEHNPCLSGGALEIFLDPSLPPPRVVIVGAAPVATALHELAPSVGLEPVAPRDGVVSVSGEDLALVVASHGREEEAALTAALAEGVPYVGLVASPRRGAAVRDALDLPEELRARLHTPAGLDIHARTPPEIALSILAEIVDERRSGAPRGTPLPGVPVQVPTTEHGDGDCCHGHG